MVVAQQDLTVHEAMEVHEILNFRTVCMARSKMMQGLVNDGDLRALMEKDVQQSITAAAELQQLLVAAHTH